MSKTSSTFGKEKGPKSSPKYLGGAYLTEVQQSLPTMPSSSKKAHKSSNSLRKSTGSLAASLGGSGNLKTLKSSTLENIEGEYIKNLQQQIYFLELESNYLYPL
uniref:Uncharacterized protein n=1 Tax=Magallana gigas TaxID=29159 RepID=A0A8W8N4B0_MAGGI